MRKTCGLSSRFRGPEIPVRWGEGLIFRRFATACKSSLLQFTKTPMFKRVAKRIRKQEEEDALGLDAEVKQVLGLNDTDSEESDDDSSDDGSLAGLEGSEDGEGLGQDGEEMDEDEGPDLFEESDSEADDQPQKIKMKMSISQALKDPIFLDPEDAMNKLCVICVGKKLKTENLVTIHRSSNACTLSLVSDRIGV